MSDIVERLRVRDFEDYNEICDKAANEIEWLRARLVEAEKQADVRLLQAQDWRARAERLAAALRECSGVIDSFGNADDGHVSPVVWRLHDAEGAVSRARAALSDSPHKGARDE